MLITTKNIQVDLGKKTILKDVSYQFEKGNIYGIIGPNGAGKSTFLKVISGFLKPVAGEVYFQGKKLYEPSKNISIVWQKPYMFQTTVYNNIAYGLKVRGTPKNQIKDMVGDILKQFNMTHLEKRKATSLSGGEAAKVAIARAVVTSPDVLILDEPTASLDPQNVLDIEKIILDLKVRYHITIIMVTHNMFQAKRIADETIYFHGGELIEAQKTSELFVQPRNYLTKRFVSGDLVY